MEFYNTIMGKKFYDGTMREIKNNLDRIANALERRTVTYAIVDNGRCLADIVNEEARKGGRYVTLINNCDGTGKCALIFEKEAEKQED